MCFKINSTANCFACGSGGAGSSGGSVRSGQTHQGERVMAAEPDVPEVCGVHPSCIVATCMSLLGPAPGSATPEKASTDL